MDRTADEVVEKTLGHFQETEIGKYDCGGLPGGHESQEEWHIAQDWPFSAFLRRDPMASAGTRVKKRGENLQLHA